MEDYLKIEHWMFALNWQKSEIYFTVEILRSYIKVKKMEQNVKTILYVASLKHLNLSIYIYVDTK